ncbi:MAG TPA: glycosyltransferase family 1 protein [Casimicrobiaceae bacterium]|nr:glycosyltransferase family 1 protein [Casimicrobiaceae bacterium]
MPLRVGFNATPLLSPLTGIGQYIVNLGRALAATGEVDLYSFYGHRWRHEPPAPPPATRGGDDSKRLLHIVKPFIPFKREVRHAQQQFHFGRGSRRFGLEIYHEPNYVPIGYDVPVVITVHDLSWLRYPETHPAERVRWLERSMPSALARAAAILVDSDFIRHEVLATFGLDPARVHTVHLGVSSAFRLRGRDETRAVLSALDLVHGQYVLAVGTIEPRKNIGHALAAYARLPERLRRRYPLVVAGARGWGAADLERELHALMARGEVRFLGHVPDEDLPVIYAGAGAFVFASIYEGFGLPPLEAMASGVPVLVADRGALPEVTADAAVRLDPEMPDDTSRKLGAVLDDAAMHAELARRGQRRAALFTWDTCARRTLGVYRAVEGAA